MEAVDNFYPETVEYLLSVLAVPSFEDKVSIRCIHYCMPTIGLSLVCQVYSHHCIHVRISVFFS